MLVSRDTHMLQLQLSGDQKMSFIKKEWIEFGCIILFCINTIILISFQLHLIAWIFVSIGLLALLLCHKRFAQNILLIYITLIILGITPISTNLSYIHIMQMVFGLGLTIAFPYLISRYFYQDYLVRFKFHHGRMWHKNEFIYIFVIAFISYLVLPFYFHDTGSYKNWSIELGISYLVRLFISLYAVGIWDELFFIGTVLGILRRYMSFKWANIVQSIVFTSFLYELGFKKWGAIMIFIFALLQGYVFKKTESLFYVITIHLTIDIILYLALIHAYYPRWITIFIT